MSGENPPKKRGNQIGPSGKLVGKNLRRLRVDANLTQQEMADRLEELGRPLTSFASIGRIERGEQRVEVDDLIALAFALEVSPLALLLPYTRLPDDRVEVTGAKWMPPAADVWRWAVGHPSELFEVDGSVEDMEQELRFFMFRSLPSWLSIDIQTQRPMSWNLKAYDDEMARADGPEPLGREEALRRARAIHPSNQRGEDR